MPASLSLSEILKQVGKALEEKFPGTFWIVAEILELHVNRSGHCYMELIEKSSENDTLLARARGTIWASRFSMLRPYFETSTGTELKSGIKLLCKASVEFHAQFAEQELAVARFGEREPARAIERRPNELGRDAVAVSRE